MIKEGLFDKLTVNQKLQFLYFAFKENEEEVKSWLLNEFKPYFEEEFSIGSEIIKDIDFVLQYLDKLLFPNFNLPLATEPGTIGEISLDIYTKELALTQSLDMLCRCVKNDPLNRAKAIISLQLLLSIFALIRDHFFSKSENNLYTGLPVFSNLIKRAVIVTSSSNKINFLSIAEPLDFSEVVKYYIDWDNPILFESEPSEIGNIFLVFFNKIYAKISS